MPYLIGLCCIAPIGGGPGGGLTSGLNEVVDFVNEVDLTLPWNATRKARFGAAGVFYVEGLGDDGKYREVKVEIVPDSVINTSSYHFDFGGAMTGRITIT